MRLLLRIVCLLAIGCSGMDEGSPSSGSAQSRPPPPGNGGDTSTQASPPGPPPDAASEAGVVPTPDASVVSSTTLEGTVSRTAAIASKQDGIGDLYVGVFDKNPITDQSAKPIGNQLIKAANLAAPGAQVPYAIGSLPSTGGTVFVIAFLDDDGNASSDQQPHKPDLVTLDNLSPVKVALTPNGKTTKDLVLNAEMPF